MINSFKKWIKMDNLKKDYWDTNYSDAQNMDGIGNRKQHVQYVKSIFELEYVDINSIIDFGFGLGKLFESFVKEFKPYKAFGLEPSKYIFNKMDVKRLQVSPNMKISLKNTDLLSWARMQKKGSRYFDLGVCTSVFQYIDSESLLEIIPVLAQKVKYLYLTVPTDKELKRQVCDLDFFDRYALRRSKTFYYKILKNNFTFISSRLLESKTHFHEKNTNFTDLLYRF